MNETFLPWNGTFSGFSVGRPVARSTPVDQFMGTYGLARITSPVARSMV